MIQLACSTRPPFDAEGTTHFALVHGALQGAGLDDSLARDVAGSIVTFIIDHMLLRHEAKGHLDEVYFDAPFATGLETLLDAIEARLGDRVRARR